MASDTIVIDKFAFVQNLEKHGFTRTQAEGLASTVKDIAFAQLATKNDLKDLELRLIKFIFTAMATQTALIVVLVELLK